jgi:hypothetical protein
VRLFYRGRQFCVALSALPTLADQEAARCVLTYTQMALQAGVSPLAAMLIQRHSQQAGVGRNLEENLLLKLQAVDDDC